MFCSNCGNKLSPSDAFCKNCGAKVTASTQHRTQEVSKPLQPNPVPYQRPIETSKQAANRKKNARTKRIILICVPIAMLCFCFISCIGWLFVGAMTDALSPTESTEVTSTLPASTPTPKEDDILGLLYSLGIYDVEEISAMIEVTESLDVNVPKAVSVERVFGDNDSKTGTFEFYDGNGERVAHMYIKQGILDQFYIDGELVYEIDDELVLPEPTHIDMEDEQTYKSVCVEATNKDVARNPSDYKGKHIMVTGEVIQVSEGWFNSVTIRLRSADSYDESECWLISYTRKSETESRVLEGDTITAYGECNGVESYTTVLGATNTVPSLDAEYIDIK